MLVEPSSGPKDGNRRAEALLPRKRPGAALTPCGWLESERLQSTRTYQKRIHHVHIYSVEVRTPKQKTRENQLSLVIKKKHIVGIFVQREQIATPITAETCIAHREDKTAKTQNAQQGRQQAVGRGREPCSFLALFSTHLSNFRVRPLFLDDLAYLCPRFFGSYPRRYLPTIHETEFARPVAIGAGGMTKDCKYYR